MGNFFQREKVSLVNSLFVCLKEKEKKGKKEQRREKKKEHRREGKRERKRRERAMILFAQLEGFFQREKVILVNNLCVFKRER